MNVGYIISRAVEQYADNICVVEGDKKITFREVGQHINQLANALLGLGLQKGDRVGVLMGNSWRCVEVDYGIIKGGLVRVPLNARQSPSELILQMTEAEAKAIIVGPEYVEQVQSMAPQMSTVTHYIATERVPSGWLNYDRFVAGAASTEPDVVVDKEDMHSFQYTSGTTGRPRAAIQDHGAWLSANLFYLAEMDTIRDSDAILHVAPMTHAAAVFMLPHFVRGARQVVLKRFDPQEVLEAIQKEKITFVVLIPTMIYMLLAYPDLRKYDHRSLKTILYATSPMSVEKLKEAIGIFGPVFQQGYGMTEAIPPVAHFAKEDHVVDGPPEKVKRLGSCGRPVIGVEVRLVDEEGNDVKTGEIGQIICRGGNLMKGYWKRPEDTERALRNGWLYTRDLARVDEDGFLYIVDRLDDMIISGGFNVYPREVEEALYAHPAVYEAAVVPVPDDKWGELVKAVVVLKPGTSATEQEIIDFCGTRLTGFKKPRSVDFVEALPKSPVGKILRRAVREKYWQGHSRLVH